MNNKVIFLILRGIGRFFNEFKSNIVSLITLCTLIFVYHIVYALSGGASAFLQYIAEVKSIRVYLENPADININNLVDSILRVHGVRNAKYYSQAEAKEYVVKNAPNMSGMKSFSEEFFPAFIDVMPANINDEAKLDNIVKEISRFNGVESVSYGKDVMTKFLNISRGATFFLLIVTGLFTVSVSFVLYNTIKLSLYRFREEIKLYSLVGGTRAFIKTPFVVSAFLNAFFAFSIGSAAFCCGFIFFNNKILYPVGINILKFPNELYFGGCFIFVCFISLLASRVSVNSFLKRLGSISEECL